MLSVSAGLTPGLVLVLTGSPALLCPRGALTPCWISVCIPSLIVAFVSIRYPVLHRSLFLTHHPYCFHSLLFLAPARNPCLVWREVIYPVPAGVPHLVLGLISTCGQGVPPVPPDVTVLTLRQVLLFACLWTLSPHIFCPQSWREPRSRWSH